MSVDIMRLALCQIDSVVGDIEGNTARIEAALQRAAEGGARIAVFPELAISGYPPEDLLLRERFPKARVVQGDAYDLARVARHAIDAPAAAVVSGLPLFTKPEERRLALLDDAFDVMHAGCPFVQFTYALVSPMPLKAGGFRAERSPRIWLNLPPAQVWTYRRG